MNQEPHLSAVEVAQQFGKSKRAVLQWASLGCPSTTGKRAGRECRLFTLEEVRLWLRTTGRDVPGSELFTPPQPQTLAAEPTQAAAGIVLPAAGIAGVDWPNMSRQLGRLLDTMLAKQPSTAGDFAAMQRLATALKNTLTELRALEEADLRRQERAGKWVDRIKAAGIMADAARQFASDLETLAADLPQAVLQALEGPDVNRNDGTATARVLTQAVRHTVDNIRARRAESIRRALEALEQAAQEAAA
jgi:hypothetical protein